MALFESSQSAVGTNQRVLLCSVHFNHPVNKDYCAGTDAEFLELANGAGAQIVKQWYIKRHSIDHQYFIGRGKVDQIKQYIQTNHIELVLFSQTLSASQQRNLEQAICCRVMDRTSLILDIFALRAHSFEGKLQVELAQLKHLSTRLVRGWTHLERQKGGLGLRGPGETQLETDRRLIGQRISHLKKHLKKVDKQRQLGRQSRRKNEIPVISLVGYTNAGKSSLFNALTQANIYASSKLFATLDTTLRKITLPAAGSAVIADTVGFVQNLPPDLIAAFKSTLDETRKADILLHVVDANDRDVLDKIHQVKKILADIGADQIPAILVMNKIDKQPNLEVEVQINHRQKTSKIWLSAKTGDGLNLLKTALSEQLSGLMSRVRIKLAPYAARFRSEIYQVGFIKREKIDRMGNWLLEIQVTRHYLDKLLRNQGIELLWQQAVNTPR